jgi:hypothetical protein
MGSDYNADVPIVYLRLTVPFEIPVEVIESLLIDPTKRKKWDKDNILEYRRLSEEPTNDTETIYMLNKFPWPMSNRDFVEERFFRSLKDE